MLSFQRNVLTKTNPFRLIGSSSSSSSVLSVSPCQQVAVSCVDGQLDGCSTTTTSSSNKSNNYQQLQQVRYHNPNPFDPKQMRGWKAAVAEAEKRLEEKNEPQSSRHIA